jgi:hypothetical protein
MTEGQLASKKKQFLDSSTKDTKENKQCHLVSSQLVSNTGKAYELREHMCTCGGWGVECYRWESARRRLWLLFSHSSDTREAQLLFVSSSEFVVLH